jgi:thiol:disulfide interchange protein DsbD
MRTAAWHRWSLPWRGLLIVALGHVFVVPPARAQAPPVREATAAHATVDLIADRADAGAPLTVGVRFRLDPGWHIYWRNPGDSGGPPTVRWLTKPAGWAPGEFTWPAPERFTTGPIVNYGYSGTVVLPVPIALAGTRSAPPSGPRELVGEVKWIACQEICVPGTATLRLAWPLEAAEQAAAGDWQVALASARDRVPTPAPTAWRATARVADGNLVLSIRTDGRAEKGTFFPIDQGVLHESAPQKVDVAGWEMRVTQKTSDLLTTPPKTLRGVIVLPSGVAHEIVAPVSDPNRKTATP